jgi:hypothetical protein
MERVQQYFYLSQVGLGILAIGATWFFFSRSREKPSNFRVREADVRKPDPKLRPGQTRPQELAQARLKPKGPETLALPGIRIDGLPHEILGIAANAPAEEIQRAFRERMKRYHPDSVGAPGSRAWKDAEKIAEAIIRARDAMLKRSGTSAQKPGSGPKKPS